MFRVKVGNKFWNFKDSKITSIKNKNILTKCSLEAEDIAEFLREILPDKIVNVEKIDDNNISNESF